MIVRGAFNHLLRPGLRKDFRDNYQAHVEEFSRFLRTGGQDRAEIEAVALSGLPRMVLRGELEPVTLLDPELSDKVIYIDDEFALGFGVSQRMMEDDLYGKARQNSKWLARSARLTQEYRAAEFLDDAFDGNVFTGMFGEALCATDHELLASGATWSNRIAGDTQLSVTGIQAAFDLAEQTVDHNGDPIVIMPTRLVINIADEPTAIALTKSDKEPFTADNTTNTVTGRRSGLNYVVSHYKTQGRDWFLQDPNWIDAHFLFRIRPQFWDYTDDSTLAAVFMGRQRINVYFFDPRGWIGSNAT